MQDYDENGAIIAVCFLINTPIGEQSVRLPANIDAVDKVLQKQKVKGGREQAERNELLGIKPNKLQLEFAQRYVYGRSYKKETWNEYKTRNGL